MPFFRALFLFLAFGCAASLWADQADDSEKARRTLESARNNAEQQSWEWVGQQLVEVLSMPDVPIVLRLGEGEIVGSHATAEKWFVPVWQAWRDTSDWKDFEAKAKTALGMKALEENRAPLYAIARAYPLTQAALAAKKALVALEAKAGFFHEAAREAIDVVRWEGYPKHLMTVEPAMLFQAAMVLTAMGDKDAADDMVSALKTRLDGAPLPWNGRMLATRDWQTELRGVQVPEKVVLREDYLDRLYHDRKLGTPDVRAWAVRELASPTIGLAVAVRENRKRSCIELEDPKPEFAGFSLGSPEMPLQVNYREGSLTEVDAAGGSTQPLVRRQSDQGYITTRSGSRFLRQVNGYRAYEAYDVTTGALVGKHDFPEDDPTFVRDGCQIAGMTENDRDWVFLCIDYVLFYRPGTKAMNKVSFEGILSSTDTPYVDGAYLFFATAPEVGTKSWWAIALAGEPLLHRLTSKDVRFYGDSYQEGKLLQLRNNNEVRIATFADFSEEAKSAPQAMALADATESFTKFIGLRGTKLFYTIDKGLVLVRYDLLSKEKKKLSVEKAGGAEVMAVSGSGKVALLRQMLTSERHYCRWNLLDFYVDPKKIPEIAVDAPVVAAPVVKATKGTKKKKK